MKLSVVICCIVAMCMFHCLAIADDAYWDTDAVPDSKITDKDFYLRFHDANPRDKLTNRGVYDDGSLPELNEEKPSIIPGQRNVNSATTQRDNISEKEMPYSLRIRRLPERYKRIERPTSVNKKPKKRIQRGTSKEDIDSGKALVDTTNTKPKQLSTSPGPRKEQKVNTVPTKPKQDESPELNKLKWGKVELKSKDDKNKLQWKK